MDAKAAAPAGWQVGTTGVFEIKPGAVNSVPREARIGIGAWGAAPMRLVVPDSSVGGFRVFRVLTHALKTMKFYLC